MTVIGTSNRTEHEGNGTLTEFPYNFRVDLLAHMTVYVAGEEMVSGWSITGLGSPTGGDIIFDVAPADEVLIVFLRVVPITQGMDYEPYDPFPAESHEHALDWLTFICQQLQEELNRKYGSPPGGGEGGDFIMPEPEAGKVLAWREDELGLENQPGIGTFIELVERSEEAAATAVASSGWAFLWAQEEEDVLVNDGIHPPGYSAYHWASKAEEGGIIDIFSEDEQMMVVNIPEPRYRSLEMLHGTPGAMVKLDHQGLVPLENMPFTGNLRFIHLFEGHDRCPKFQYEIPDETPCVEPDTRNPSERVPSIDWDGGDYFVVVQCDEEPLLNQVNLINPETGLYEITDVQNGDAILWLEGDEGLAEPGWYLYPGFATDSVLAENVIFDDTMTDIKGITVQEWNQAADAVIQDKVDQSGDLMTGNLAFMNDIGLQGYLNDAVTEIAIIRLNVNNDIKIGGYADHDGDTLIAAGDQNFIRLNQSDNRLDFLQHVRMLNIQQLMWRNAEDDADIGVFIVTAANDINIGGITNQPVTALVNIRQGGTDAITISQTEITFNRAISFGSGIHIDNNQDIDWRNAEDDADINVLRVDINNDVQIGGRGSHPVTSDVLIYQGGTQAVTISDAEVLINKSIVLGSGRAISQNTSGIIVSLIYASPARDLTIGGVGAAAPDSIYLRPAAGSGIIIPNNSRIRSERVPSGTVDMLTMNSENAVYLGGVLGQNAGEDVWIRQMSTDAVRIQDDLWTFLRPVTPMRGIATELSGIEEVNLNIGDRIRMSFDSFTTIQFENTPVNGRKQFILETNGHVVDMPAGLLWEAGVTPLMNSGVWVVDLIIDDGMILASAKQYS